MSRLYNGTLCNRLQMGRDKQKPLLNTMLCADQKIKYDQDINARNNEDTNIHNALHYLLNKNHALLDIRYETCYTNHIVYTLYSLAELGADEARLNACYEHKKQRLAPLRPPKEHLGLDQPYRPIVDPEYYSAFLNYFDQKIADLGFDAAITHYLPLVFTGLLGAVGHPAIHLGYAVKYRNSLVLAEALAYASCAELSIIPYADELYNHHSANNNHNAIENNSNFKTILDNVRKDHRLDSFNWKNEQVLVLILPLLNNYKSIIQEYFNTAPINKDQLETSRVALQLLAVDMYIGSARNQLFDFFILHVITTCHAIDQFYSILAPPSLQLRLIRSLWLYLLVVYICQGRPPIDSATILEPFSDTRLYSWPIIFNLALDHQDEHVPKLVKAMYSLEKKYGVCHGKWRATAAATVKLVTTENQWSFIGKGKTAR